MYLFVVIGGLGAHESDAIVTELGVDLQLFHELIGPGQRFVVGIQRRVDGGRARVDALRDVDQILLFGRFVLLGRGIERVVGVGHFDPDVGEEVDAAAQRFVAVVRAGDARNSHDGQRRRLHHNGALQHRDLQRPTRRTSKSIQIHSFFYCFF